MSSKYNLWLSEDNGKTFHGMKELPWTSGENQFASIVDGQKAVEIILGKSLDWITPHKDEYPTDDELYDPIYGYKRHLVAYFAPPDSYAYDGQTRYSFKKITPHITIEEELPTLGALQYALQKCDSGWGQVKIQQCIDVIIKDN